MNDLKKITILILLIVQSYGSEVLYETCSTDLDCEKYINYETCTASFCMDSICVLTAIKHCHTGLELYNNHIDQYNMALKSDIIPDAFICPMTMYTARCTDESENSISESENENGPVVPVCATLRDFKSSHKDMQSSGCSENWLVNTILGPDKKPVYNTTTDGGSSITSQETFNQWYNDVDDVNCVMHVDDLISFSTFGTSSYGFYFPQFFPLDRKCFDNSNNGHGTNNGHGSHNFHFTLESHFSFHTICPVVTPNPLEQQIILTHDSDDDFFLFIDNELVIDSGGIHPIIHGSVTYTVNPCTTYDIAMFFAERHTTNSNLGLTISGYVDSIVSCNHGCCGPECCDNPERECYIDDDCHDYDFCTLDICNIDGYCEHSDHTAPNPCECHTHDDCIQMQSTSENICDECNYCSYGICQHIIPELVCDDNNHLTEDICIDEHTCQYYPLEGHPQQCIYSEITADPSKPCIAYPGDEFITYEPDITTTYQINCDDCNVCTIDSCCMPIGCVHNWIPNCCNNDNDCTNIENLCEVGTCNNNNICVYTMIECNDFNTTTRDTCDVQTGECIYEYIICPFTNLCEEGIYNEIFDTCIYTETDCDDGLPYTNDYCDINTGLCVNNETDCWDCKCVCDDFNECTNDYCSLETFCCVHEKISCDDNNECTQDSCDANAGGCVFTPLECDDHNVCTIEMCNNKTGCLQTDILNCDDNNTCTYDYCDPIYGCEHQTIQCNDNIPCTIDTCDPILGCQNEPMNCDDYDNCTIDSCSIATGLCEHFPVVCPWAGGIYNACIDGVCSPESGECEYSERVCVSTSLCMQALCDYLTGDCYEIPINCETDNWCTESYCNETSGLCIQPEPIMCHDEYDFDPCFIYPCDSEYGCTTPVAIDCGYNRHCAPDGICYDNDIICPFLNPCLESVYNETSRECDYEIITCPELNNTCYETMCDLSLGRCIATEILCDDSNLYTFDYCDKNTGECVFEDIVCDDKNPCTVDTYNTQLGECEFHDIDCGIHNHTCYSVECNIRTGQCEPIYLDCDDKSKCTDDYCDPNIGCVNEIKLCNTTGLCMHDCCNAYTGECEHFPVDCNDNNACTEDSCNEMTGVCDNIQLCYPEEPSLCLIYTCNHHSGICIVIEKCDDENDYTIDSCNETTGECIHEYYICEAPEDLCFESHYDSDQQRCIILEKDCGYPTETTIPVCREGVCLQMPYVYEDTDNNMCTYEAYDIDNDMIIHVPKLCIHNSLNPCILGICVNATGECIYTTKDCDDMIKCTSDSCDSISGECVHVDMICESSSECVSSICNETLGECVTKRKDCSDGDLCTEDTCDDDTGECLYTDILCESSTECVSGTCDELTGECVMERKECNDYDLCTRDDCDDDTGECIYVPVVCRSDNACEIPSCDNETGMCIYDRKICLDDGLICTNQLCDPVTGDCLFDTIQCPVEPSAAACYVGICDENAAGCLYTFKCEDNNLCTTDVCAEYTGVCSNINITCDDNDIYTIDSCDPMFGCRHIPTETPTTTITESIPFITSDGTLSEEESLELWPIFVALGVIGIIGGLLLVLYMMK